MANESLVMSVEVRDLFSAQLRKLQTDLKSLSTTGAASTKTLQKDWKGVGSEIQAASGAIVRDMLPAMRLGGLAGLTLGGAIGGAAIALKNFAQNTMTIGNFSKEIGLASREVAKLQAMGGFFGIDPSTAQGNFRTFQTFLQAMRKDGGETISHLKQVFGAAGDELAGVLLRPGSFKEKMEAAFTAIRNVDSEPTARKMAQELFGNEAWATAIRNMTPELQAAFAKIASKIDENKDAAIRFNVALAEWNVTVQNLMTQAFSPLLKVTTELMDKWRSPIENKFKDFADDIALVSTALDKILSGNYLEGLKQLGKAWWEWHPLSKILAPGGEGTATPGSTAIAGKMNSLFSGAPSGGAAPGSPAKTLEKSNDELKRSTDELKRSNDKQTSLWERIVGAAGMGGDTAGLGPGLGGVSAGGGGLGGVGALRQFMGGGGGGPSIRHGAVTGGGPMRPGGEFDTSIAGRSGLPAGMRNNNPGNLKFSSNSSRLYPGVIGPSANTDQGDPQIKFDTPQAGMQAMALLAKRKFGGGRDTVNKLIASPGGWTPGNYAAASNVARSMGVGPNDPINLNDSGQMTTFMRGMMLQEHGPASRAYSDQMIQQAIQDMPTGHGAPPAALGDLRIKGGATGGGETAGGVVSLAQWAQSNISGFNRVTAMNDRFHRLRRGSAHNRGLATDFTINDPRQSAAAAQQLREHIMAQGLDPSEFKVLDEYKRLSAGGTGGHLHAQFQSEEAAARYRKSMLLQQQQKAEKAQESKLEATGTVNVHLHDGLREKNAKVDTDGMFKDVKVNRGRPMNTAEDNPLGRASAGF
jgi:hypothetical protein